MKYLINWDYASGIGGPWKEGDTVEIDAALAARINNDSPGVLTLESEAQARAVEVPDHDRMLKAPRQKRGKHVVGDHGEMTRDTFKAVKDK